MKNVITLFVFLFYYCLIALSQNVTIKGNIIASSDGLPVKDVNISVKGKTIGTSSDERGNFILKNASLPCVLSVSHLAFFSQDISLTTNDVNNKNLVELNIQLNDKVTTLTEVEIKDTPPVYQLERLVYDFEIDSSNLYVIRNSKDKKLLQVYSFEDYPREKIFIPKHCNVIEYDYSNNLIIRKVNAKDYFIVSNIENKELSLEKKEFDIVERGIGKIVSNRDYYYGVLPNILDTDIRHFNEFRILESTFSNRFFTLLLNNKKTLVLFMIHPKKDQIKYTSIYYTTYYCGDWLLNKEQFFLKDYKITRYSKNISIPIHLQYNISTLNQIKKNFKEQLSFGLFMSRQRIPVYIEIVEDKVLIINLEKQIIYTLDSKGKLLEEEIINYKFQGNELESINDVILNKEKTKFYVVFKNPYTTKLKEIDLLTGENTRTIILRSHFVDKIRIVGKNIYYTARTEGINGLERWLFKEKIDDELTQN